MICEKCVKYVITKHQKVFILYVREKKNIYEFECIYF